MLAQRANDVFRKFIAFVDIAADFADKTFFTFCFRLRFYILLVISVSHGILITHNTGFCNATDEHSMRIKVDILFYFQ